MERKYAVVLSRNPNTGWYAVSCPAMPGALSQGQTREEALANIAEAMELWAEPDRDGSAPPIEVETPELIAAEIAEVLGFRAEEDWDPIIETAMVAVRVPLPV